VGFSVHVVTTVVFAVHNQFSQLGLYNEFSGLSPIGMGD